MQLFLILFVVFLDWMGIGLVYPMFSTLLFNPDSNFVSPELSEGARGWYLGILLAIISIAQFFSGPVFGTLSDQKGRKPIFLFSLSLAVVGYSFCVLGVFWKSIAFLIGARAIVGIASGNASVVSAAVVDLSTPENKAKNFGLYNMASGVGFAVGPFLGGILSEFGFTMPFIVSGLATLISLVLIFWFYRESHTVRKQSGVRFDDGLRKLTKVFRLVGFRGLFLTVFVFCCGWSFFYEFLPVTWIADYAFSAGEIGFFYAYGAAWYALSAGLLIRPIVSRFRPLAILFWALFLLGIIILALIADVSVGWLWFYLPVVNFLIALTFPTYYTIVSNWTSDDAQGEILGVLQSVQAAAFAISPLIAGVLLKVTSHMPMWIGGVSMVFAMVIIGISLRDKIFSKQR